MMMYKYTHTYTHIWLNILCVTMQDFTELLLFNVPICTAETWMLWRQRSTFIQQQNSRNRLRFGLYDWTATRDARMTARDLPPPDNRDLHAANKRSICDSTNLRNVTAKYYVKIMYIGILEQRQVKCTNKPADIPKTMLPNTTYSCFCRRHRRYLGEHLFGFLLSRLRSKYTAQEKRVFQ
jgi:hypothetical protein